VIEGHEIVNLTRTEVSGARHVVRLGGLAACALATALLLPPTAVFAADTEFNARYSARLAILPFTFATGTLRAVVPERGRYTVNFDAKGPSFTMSGRATGVVQANVLWPITSSTDSADSSESRKITITMSRGRVRRETVVPPLPYRPDRVPLTQEHRKGVTDPVSALLMPVLSKGGPAEPGNCDRTLQIFEGTERFDIRMSYLRTEIVKTLKGYEGPAVVCRASYKAIAGHRSNSSAQYMEQNRTIEAWLVPIGGTNMMAPWRVSFATRVGTLILEASEFTSSANPMKQTDAATASVQPVSETGTPR
jgi:hypothetical protein